MNPSGIEPNEEFRSEATSKNDSGKYVPLTFGYTNHGQRSPAPVVNVP